MRHMIAASLLLTGCAANHRPPPVAPPMVEATKVNAPAPTPVAPPVEANLIEADSPEVQDAFDKYVKTGKAPAIVNKSEGFVTWPYGLSQPTARCRPLEICRIELEPGEKVRTLVAGDSERWILSPMYSGPDDALITHVAAKPTDYTRDMETTLSIGTDRRVYDVRLVSKLNGAVVRAKFYYPEDLIRRFNTEQSHAHQEQQTVAATNIDIASLDDRYEIEGNTAWRPTWVANDGTHTYIKMPPTLRQSDAPALFIQQPNGETALLNYRLHQNYYITDRLFDRAVLVWGVGSNKQTVTISRGKP
jgi:P-type conjugative transfer protein TrbG